MMQRSGGFIGALGIALIFLMFIGIMAGCSTNAATRTYTDPVIRTPGKATASSIPSTEKEQTVKQDQTDQPPVAPAPKKGVTEPTMPANLNEMSFGEILRERGISANADFTIVVQKHHSILRDVRLNSLH